MGSKESKNENPHTEAPPPNPSNQGKRIPRSRSADDGPRYRGIVVVGSHGSGKSSIIAKLEEHLQNQNDDYYHFVELSGDTETMTSELRKAQVHADELSETARLAIVYVVDLTNPESLHLLSRYIQISTSVSWATESIVANKIDLPEEQRLIKLMDFADHLGRLQHTSVKKVSGLTGQGIDALTEQLRLRQRNTTMNDRLLLDK